jgi:hypothetical protein
MLRSHHMIVIITSALLLDSRLVQASGPVKAPVRVSTVSTGAVKGAAPRAPHTPKPTTVPHTAHSSHVSSTGSTTASGKPHSPKKPATLSANHASTGTSSGAVSAPSGLTIKSGPTLNPQVARNLQHDNGLIARLQSKLGPGVDLTTAASGFRNWGQFVAAVNNSKNATEFWQLRAKMTGFTRDGTSTNAPAMSLGQAKQTVAPGDTTQTRRP